MNFEKFQINVENIKISGSERSISKTIEELLHLNKMIPSRWEDDSEINILTNKQFEKSKHYDSKNHRGEQIEPYEKQLTESRKETVYPVQEAQLNESSENDGGHHYKEKDIGSEEKVRGHKEKNVPPIWLDVFKKEDKRKDDGSLKKELKK